MFFEDASEIQGIARKTGTAVFVVPRGVKVEIRGATVLEPEEKSVITIEQVREVIARLGVRQAADFFVIIRPAEKLNEEAANALLKNLEEPGEKVHFVLIAEEPSALMPTILSRAAVYFLRVRPSEGIETDEKKKALAKKLMVARGEELVAVAEEIAKKKEGVRAYAMEIVGLTIEMLYKSYFITGKQAFLTNLPKFLRLYENLAKNGHVKLQIVANLC